MLRVAGLGVLVAACTTPATHTTGAEQPVAATEAPPETGVPAIDPTLCDPAGKDVREADASGDGKADVWKLFAADGALTCARLDTDFDGSADHTIAYDRTGAILVEHYDFDFDGRTDARHFYDPSTGKVHLVVRDTNRDDRADVWESLDAGGQLISARRDTDASGEPDVQETYHAGVLVHVERDTNGDGKPDVEERYHRGTLRRVARDTDADGRPDVLEDYDDGGRLATVHRDRNGDARPDVWETHRDGQLVMTRWDDDFDGKADRTEPAASDGEHGDGARD